MLTPIFFVCTGGVCENWWCPHGKECVTDSHGAPECVCVRSCHGKKAKPVCGTDGRFYENHCELHRMACMSESSVAVDHSSACFLDNADKLLKLTTGTKDHNDKGILSSFSPVWGFHLQFHPHCVLLCYEKQKWTDISKCRWKLRVNGRLEKDLDDRRKGNAKKTDCAWLLNLSSKLSKKLTLE